MQPAEMIRASGIEHILPDEQNVICRFVRSKSAKKLRIKVKLGVVDIIIPKGREDEEGIAFLAQNQVWVIEQIQRVKQLSAVRLEHKRIRGQIYFLGELVPIRIRHLETWRASNRVTLEGGEISITRGRDCRSLPVKSLENWLRKQARERIEQYIAEIGDRINRAPNRVYIMGQRTKWGNCSALNNLSFNWRLVMAPEHILRYIVTHEMVHLVIPDHSQRFWLTVQSLCPTSERARQWLVGNSSKLMVDLSSVIGDENADYWIT